MDLSNFTLSEIVNANKEYFQNKFIKLKVENKDYILLIGHIGAAIMSVTLCFKNDDLNEKNPIEHAINNYKDQIANEFEESDEIRELDFLDLENRYYYPSLNSVLENYDIKLSELNNKANDYVSSLFINDRMTLAMGEDFRFRTLETPTTNFESELSKFLKEISYERINNDENLQKKLTKIYEYNQKVEKETNEHMEKVRKKEKMKQEFNEQLRPVSLKKSNDYNIRW